MVTKIGVASLGDPRDQRTWSGTPSNVISALERLQVQVMAIDGRESDLLTRTSLFASHQVRRPWLHAGVRGHLATLNGEGRFDYNWGPAARKLRGRRVASTAERQQVSTILHMGTLTIPHSGDRSRRHAINHYVLCDSTWHQFASHIRVSGRMSRSQVDRINAAEAAVLRQMKHIFVVGEHVREAMERHYNVPSSRITCVGSGFNIPAYHGAKNYQEGHVLFVGKARWHDKGGDLLIDGFRLARQKLPSARLTVVGQEHNIKDLQREPGIQALEFVEHRRLQQLFANASIYAMPALYEPWGIVYLEALATRTPILGLDRFAFPEISQRNRFGFSIPRPTPQAVADTLVQALSNPSLLEAMGSCGQNHVLNRYSWDNVAQKIMGVLEQKVRR